LKFKPFLLSTVLAAITIAGTAALFSVTGISSLFAGHQLQVGIMAGSLEAGKIVIASILYRYWTVMSKLMKSYMVVALLALMLITSAGIFGYLSDAYQKTKSNYDVVDKEIQLLDSKKKLFQQEYDRYNLRLSDLIGNRTGQETRLDSLYSRGQITSAKRVEESIKKQDEQIADLNVKILSTSDSLSAVETRMIEKQTINASGELGPLLYLSVAFNTDMDTVVKWFILILIFVFDPLAVILIVAANMIYINKHYERPEWMDVFGKNKQVEIDPRISKVVDKHFDELFKSVNPKKIEKQMEEEANKLDPVGEVLFPLEALPADKNTKILDNNNVSENDSPEVKPEAPEMNKGEETMLLEEVPIKKKKFREWKSSNWIEPES